MLVLLVGAALIGGNLYETLRRSTIPLAVEGTVVALEVRHEKHPPIDDVHLIHTAKDTYHVDTYHVDEAVARELEEGDRLTKAAWSHSLQADNTQVDLEPSRDFNRMLIVMPFVALICMFLALSRRRGSTGMSRLEPTDS